MSDISKNIPSIQDFCVSEPLYAEVSANPDRKTQLYKFITLAANLDLFCVDCQQPSVFNFRALSIGVPSHQFDLDDRIFTRSGYCSRDNSHWAHFHFEIKNGLVRKIGQSPSLADISEAGLRPYSKVLEAEEYRELTKAVGLASHGIGIGSFVYLRRIFERLIDEAKKEQSKLAGWDDSAFQRARMEEKIEMLEAQLPPFLVEQRKLYSILSKGIHSLSEKDCLAAFPVVRTGIELILDQKVAAKQRDDKLVEARKQIGLLQQNLAPAANTPSPDLKDA